MIAVDGSIVSGWFQPRKPDTHKGTYGKVLLVAGSPGMGGAALLAGKAALRSGVGLLTIAVPEEMFPIMQSSLWEAVLKDRNHPLVNLEQYHGMAIGPGLGMSPKEGKLVRHLLTRYPGPVVVDADGLNHLAKNRDTALLKRREGPVLITPHPKEAQRLLALNQAQYENLSREEVAASLVDVTSAWVVLKGYGTLIMSPEKKVVVNSSGNPGMATGGTGDVLTGIILGLLGTGFTPWQAAVAGVYIHGLAGDLAATERGMISLMASDLLDFLPMIFQKMERE
jgi:NAD(P)H-hydrate epimerase